MDKITHATRFQGWTFCCPKCHGDHTVMASIENFPGARISLQCRPDTCGYYFTAILGDELGHPLSKAEVEQSCRVMDKAKREMPSDILWDEKGCVKGNKSVCKCGKPAAPLHTCPYKTEVDDDKETLCNCCYDCKSECLGGT